jgi:hypothetical protein
MGRFLSPDWSATIEPVPYATLDDPQSLNLYAYVLNNPLGMVDPDGHGYTLDGQDIPDDMAHQLLSGGGAAQCPNSVCSGLTKSGAWVDYVATANDMGGYFSIDQAGRIYDWNGQFISEQQFNKITLDIQYHKVISDYMKVHRVTQAQAEAAISEANATMEGGHWNFPYIGSDPTESAGNYRVPGSTLHFPAHDPGQPSTVHDDTANPFPIWTVWNLILHGAVDYVGGHTVFQAGFTF